jgi:hypothetical protein
MYVQNSLQLCVCKTFWKTPMFAFEAHADTDVLVPSTKNAAEMIRLKLIISCYNTDEQVQSLNAHVLNYTEAYSIMSRYMKKLKGATPVLLLHETCNSDHRTFPTCTKKWREEKNYFLSNVCVCTTTIHFYIFIHYLIHTLSKPVRSHND